MPRQTLLEPRPHGGGALGLHADQQGARHQRFPAPRIRFQGGEDPLERPAALGGVRTVGLGREGDGDGRCLLGRERERQRHGGAGHGAGHAADGGDGPLTISRSREDP